MSNETTTSAADDDEFVYLGLSKSQYTASVAVALTSCSLSILGSLSIIYIVIVNRKLDQLYHRIVMGLSIMDFIMTAATASMPFANRSDIGLFFAVGNAQSCTAAGFFYQAWLGSTIYNATLSIYFLLTVKHGLQEQQISKAMEPYCHVLVISVPLVFGIVAVSVQGINPLPYVGICDIGNPFPGNCLEEENIECERSGLATRILGLFQLATMVIGALTGIWATVRVYLTVRQQLLRGNVSHNSNVHNPISETQLKRIQAVRNQAICYTSAFAVSFFSAFFGLYDDPNIAWPLIVIYIFFPLQGFWNAMIYTRPRLLRWKDANPDQSWFWAYRQVLSGRPAPTTRKTAHLQKSVQSSGNNSTSDSTRKSTRATLLSSIRQLSFLNVYSQPNNESTCTNPGHQGTVLSGHEIIPEDDKNKATPAQRISGSPSFYDEEASTNNNDHDAMNTNAMELSDSSSNHEERKSSYPLSGLVKTVGEQVALIQQGLREEQVPLKEPLSEKSTTISPDETMLPPSRR
ncbi:expressed unknown protein [Seminavis robusta]|uniref:G-protein coupled receptors family 2 profile 2 domain-containing protein n=1 Tax=Seminavis robusta TaxID=568900 RepID=A0A9N8DJM3_9STRA|nr:expressed unknown protein [Seminavis robusta]|eukprot:Sro164_g073550.1 n/a (518) ;mRNA; r:28789-30342